MVAVEAPDFAKAFVAVRARFPHAMLYGRRIRWQSAQPEADVRDARKVLADVGIAVAIETQSLSMEDTFVSVLRSAGLGGG